MSSLDELDLEYGTLAINGHQFNGYYKIYKGKGGKTRIWFDYETALTVLKCLSDMKVLKDYGIPFGHQGILPSSFREGQTIRIGSTYEETTVWADTFHGKILYRIDFGKWYVKRDQTDFDVMNDYMESMK